MTDDDSVVDDCYWADDDSVDYFADDAVDYSDDYVDYSDDWTVDVDDWMRRLGYLTDDDSVEDWTVDDWMRRLAPQ